MDGGAVPDDGQPAGDAPQQRLKELGDFGTADAVLANAEVAVAQRQAGDRRELVPVEGLPQRRGLSSRRPSARPAWTRAQPAFVEEDNGAPLAAGFSLMRGQSAFFQRAMAASSRPIARRLGCRKLKPRWRSSFRMRP